MQKKLKDIIALRKDFPSSFLWGASIASHQVEGHQRNQWVAWEHETAARSAATAEGRLSVLDSWAEIKRHAKDPHNYISGRGVDHFHKYRLDFQLASRLGHNSMRSGIEWSRVCPEEGVVDKAILQHYSEYFKQMHMRGITPVVNLFHWTVPVWFAEKGGFAKKENIKFWLDFVHAVLQYIDFSHVRYVLIINEANTYSLMSYTIGEFPPGKRSKLLGFSVYRNLATAHRKTYKMIKVMHPNIRVGSAHQCNNIIGSDVVGKIGARVQAWYWNWAWLRWAKYHDFIGLNYYFTDQWSGFSTDFASVPRKGRRFANDLGWFMDPSGIEQVIRNIAKHHKGTPILITENGVADMHDQYREWWLAETIEALARCLKDKIPVIGYLHWSLLDNFEWQFGWWPKFGLISVDRKTMQRSVKKSARVWSAWLRS